MSNIPTAVLCQHTTSNGQQFTDFVPIDQFLQWLFPQAPKPEFSTPNARTLLPGQAYQAIDPTMAAIVTVNLNSTASLSLGGGTTNTADIVVGPTSAVASSGGTQVGHYANSMTGALTVSLNVSTQSGYTATFALPAGWYFAIRVTAGTVSVVSATDQSVG